MNAEDGDELQGPIPFGNYLLLHRLGQGGMGDVFLAKLTGLPGIDKLCVVKTLRARVAADEEYVRRFIDEARVVVQLSHRNICSVFDVGRVGKQYYLAMDYIAGHNLRDLLKTKGRALPEELVLFVMCEMLEALDYAHRLRDPLSKEHMHIVHRDVSPQNVMATHEGEVKLIDFGLATSTRKSLQTQPNVVMGKMAYMSPEQARGEDVDARADLYAAGIIGVELLCGQRFYDGLTVDEIWRVSGKGGFRPGRYERVDAGLRKIFDRALDVSHEKRYRTCSDFREALLDYAHKRSKRVDNRELRSMMGALYGEEEDIAHEVLSRFSVPSLEIFIRKLDLEDESRSQSQSYATSGLLMSADGSPVEVDDEEEFDDESDETAINMIPGSGSEPDPERTQVVHQNTESDEPIHDARTRLARDEQSAEPAVVEDKPTELVAAPPVPAPSRPPPAQADEREMTHVVRRRTGPIERPVLRVATTSPTVSAAEVVGGGRRRSPAAAILISLFGLAVLGGGGFYLWTQLQDAPVDPLPVVVEPVIVAPVVPAEPIAPPVIDTVDADAAAKAAAAQEAAAKAAAAKDAEAKAAAEREAKAAAAKAAAAKDAEAKAAAEREAKARAKKKWLAKKRNRLHGPAISFSESSPLTKLFYLNKHCMGRVPCAKTLWTAKSSDNGQLNTCITQCRKPKP